MYPLRYSSTNNGNENNGCSLNLYFLFLNGNSKSNPPTQSCENINMKRTHIKYYKSIHSSNSVILTSTLFRSACATSLEKVSESLFIQISQSNVIPLQ